MASGRGSFCESCSWQSTFGKRTSLIQHSFDPVIQPYFINYSQWLLAEVGSHKAALLITKHSTFFQVSESLWFCGVPNYESLLICLRSSGLRKYELPFRWLQVEHGVEVAHLLKSSISEQDQIATLLNKVPENTLSSKILGEYYLNMMQRFQAGKTSIRSVRLAIKPAVELLLETDLFGQVLPTRKSLKAYLSKSIGQRAALTGFAHYLDINYGTNLKISELDDLELKVLSNRKLEKILLELRRAPQEDFDEVEWIKIGLQYFHGVSRKVTGQLAPNMYKNCQDGYEVFLESDMYWIPFR